MTCSRPCGGKPQNLSNRWAGIWNATETTSFKILAFRVKEKWMNFEVASTDWNNRFVN
jgi:hypothetical protein